MPYELLDYHPDLIAGGFDHRGKYAAEIDPQELATKGGPLTRVVKAEGKVLVVGGAIPFWAGRCEAWALLAKDLTLAEKITATRGAIEWLDWVHDQGFWRIESSADVAYYHGRKWLELLGFELEGIARRYNPFARDHAMYARLMKNV